ncbi:hypothetical protein C1646_765641 [Rhizophagus diaphanus]|nr:hypothetical protein C1646_765641 [Rhizophagus diaphanus] [Rhizophagus sp. MUCL 43196]
MSIDYFTKWSEARIIKRDMAEEFEIKYNLSMSYHSQNNGLVERNKTNPTKKVKPFYLIYGRKANFIGKETKNKEYYNSKKKRKEEFKIEDEVLRYNAVQQNSKSNKLDDK